MLTLILGTQSTRGQPQLAHVGVSPAAEFSFPLADAPENAKRLLSSIVRQAIPHDYEDAKKWGQTRRTWDGLHLRMDGFELKTKRKWKEANHGTWRRYHVEMINPDENFVVQLSNFSKREDGTTEFDVTLTSALNCFGQMQRWNRGVKIFSISAEARADVDIGMRCAVGTSMDLRRLPPDILFHPEVLDAKVDLRQFKLDRISHVDGPLVHELGDALEKLLRRELADRSDQLVVKMNRQIGKNEDDLRLSLHDRLKYAWLQVEPEAPAP